MTILTSWKGLKMMRILRLPLPLRGSAPGGYDKKDTVVTFACGSELRDKHSALVSAVI